MTLASSNPWLPTSFAQLMTSASAAIAAQQLPNAESHLRRAIQLAPESVDAQRLMGVVQLMRHNATSAVGYLRRAVGLSPDDFNVHMNLGSALFECHETEAGLASMRRACELAPDQAATWYNLGRALNIARHPEEARTVLERAMALDPAHVMTRMTLANVQNSLGEIKVATVLYRGILADHPNHAKAWFELCNLKTTRLDDNELQRLKTLAAHDDKSTDDRVWLGYALAKALEDKGELAASFATLQHATAIMHQRFPWDIEAERQRIDCIIGAFHHPMPPAMDPMLGHEVIFISCVPRSGSTLAEHILASHSMVEGANEISDLQIVLAAESDRRQQTMTHWAPQATAGDWNRLGREYLDRTIEWRKKKPLFTDKSLGNWSLIGPALAMLPGARVVNTLRDPLENCFACYRQLFSSGAAFSYDLTCMADYYAGYRRLTRFWKERYPTRWHDHVYEDLLASPEQTIRGLLAFCGLPFEPACLTSHKTARPVRSTASAAQVRQPLHAGTSRAARYGDLLDPLRNSLRRLGIE